MAAEPRSEARASRGDALRRPNPNRDGHTRNRQREPTEYARPPEHTNHGSSRGERGRNRRTGTDHETKIRKNKAHPPQANPQKSRPNPQKSRPNRKKEASATRRKPARKPTTNGTNDSRQQHPKPQARAPKAETTTAPAGAGGEGDPPNEQHAQQRHQGRKAGKRARRRKAHHTQRKKQKPHTSLFSIFWVVWLAEAKRGSHKTCAPGWFNYFFDNSRIPKSGLPAFPYLHATKER